MRYEYKVVPIFKGFTNLEKKLNELGQQGWRLCFIEHELMFLIRKVA